MTRVVLLTPSSSGRSKIRVVSKLHLKAFVPSSVNRAITFPILASSIRNVSAFFIHSRPPNEMSPSDAKHLGALLVDGAFPKRRSAAALAAAVQTFVRNTSCLSSLQREAPWLAVTLAKIIRNRASLAKPVQGSMDDLTDLHAARVGKGMAGMLLSNASPQAAVSEWALKFPVVGELEMAQETPWVRPFFEGMAAAIVERATLGVKLRAYGGAAMSFCDAVSDVTVTVVYLADGRYGYAYGMIGLVSLTFVLQGSLIAVRARAKRVRNSAAVHLRQKWAR
jgi:hypothetical protein